MDIIIKKVKLAELKTLHALSRDTFVTAFAHLNTEENMKVYLSDHLTEDTLQSELNNPDSEFYFAELEGQPIGYIKLNTGPAQSDLREAGGLEIERIYVSQEHQGKQIGNFFINESIGIARQKNKTYIWLGVWDQNDGAIRFYQKNGFVAFGSHPFKLGDDMQTDLLMKMELQ